MELDELKTTWQHSQIIKPKNTDIMKLLQHKSNGPVAALKKEYKKQMILMLIVPVFILATNIDHIEKTLSSDLFWSYIVFALGVVVFASYNYRIVSRIEGMSGMVKSNLEEQVNTLETRKNLLIVGLRIALLFFIALTEVLPYFQDFKMLNTWHSINPFIRFGAYAAFFILQYFFSRMMIERKFGSHIKYLRQLVKEME